MGTRFSCSSRSGFIVKTPFIRRSAGNILETIIRYISLKALIRWCKIQKAEWSPRCLWVAGDRVSDFTRALPWLVSRWKQRVSRIVSNVSQWLIFDETYLERCWNIHPLKNVPWRANMGRDYSIRFLDNWVNFEIVNRTFDSNEITDWFRSFSDGAFWKDLSFDCRIYCIITRVSCKPKACFLTARSNFELFNFSQRYYNDPVCPSKSSPMSFLMWRSIHRQQTVRVRSACV